MPSPVQDYKRIRKLGSGAYGEVWEVESPAGKRVALKRLFHAQNNREIEALELVKNLGHAFLLEIHDFWEEDGQFHILTQLADETLEDCFKRHRKEGLPGVPVEDLLRHISDAADALDFMHERGVHHRDIKPKNLLLLGGRVKVADFGLVRPAPTGDESTTQAIGSAPYMAPEVWENRLSKHSDQYSLAVTYVEMRQGKRPFTGEHVMQLVRAQLNNEPHLSGLSPEEQRVVRKALATNPEGRYSSCREFAAELARALEPQPTIPPPTPPTPTRLLSILLLLAGLVGLVWLIYNIVVPVPSPPPPRLPDVSHEHIYQRILEHVEKAPADSIRYLRFFSMRHIPMDRQPRHREALVETLSALSGRQVSVQSVDADKTIYAVDLRELGWELGWDRQPFQGEKWNLFDLVLLEYPYATFAERSETFGALAAQFLEKAGQIRPVAYVRADWFVSAAARSPLADDLLSRDLYALALVGGSGPCAALAADRLAEGRERLSSLPASKQVLDWFHNETVDLDCAARELGLSEAEPLAEVIRRPGFEPLQPLANEGNVARGLWEKHFASIAESLGLGVPILPIDGLTYREMTWKPALEIKLATVGDRRAIKVGEGFQIDVHNDSQREVHIELLGTDTDGEVLSIIDEWVKDSHGILRLPAGEHFRPERRFSPSDPGQVTINLFALDRRFLPGKRLRAWGVKDRFVHPVYGMSDDGQKLLPGDVPSLKRTITIDVK